MHTMTPHHADTHLALAERVRSYIDAHADEPLPLVRLAREAGVSPAHLQRTFTRVVECRPGNTRNRSVLARSSLHCARDTP